VHFRRLTHKCSHRYLALKQRCSDAKPGTFGALCGVLRQTHTPIGAQKCPRQPSFNYNSFLGYVPWRLCCGADVWPRLKTIDRVETQRHRHAAQRLFFFGLVIGSARRLRDLCGRWRLGNRGAGNARTTRAEDPSLGTGAVTEPVGAKIAPRLRRRNTRRAVRRDHDVVLRNVADGV
jgi:hypothetical protein